MSETLSKLIERVEAATEGSRELDVLLGCLTDDSYEMNITLKEYVEAFGLANAVERSDVPQSILYHTLPKVSSSIDAALALTERLGLTVHTVHHGRSFWSVDVCVPDNAMLASEGEALTFPLAIIIATLRALEASP